MPKLRGKLLNRFENSSYGGANYCDFFIYRDKEKLIEVIDKLMEGEAKIERDPEFIEKNFPGAPREFYGFWEEMMAGGGKAG